MKRRASILKLLTIALSPWVALACSSNSGPSAAPSRPDSAQVESGESGGIGGETGGPPPLSPAGAAPLADCTQAPDCDDGLACNGLERCEDGACAPGEPLVCDNQQTCSEVEGGSCVYEDQSPWIVYTADDETPALIEAYAVKRDLIGQMTPFKISAGVTPGSRPYYVEWAPRGKLVSFVVGDGGTAQSRVQLVYFGDGAPRQVGALDGDDIRWSPSGHFFAVTGRDELAFYSHAGAGDVQQVFSYPADISSGGWTKNEDFIFSTRDATTGLSSINRVFEDTTGWRTVVLVQGLDLTSFRLSPTFPELVYGTRKPDGSSYGPLYSLQWSTEEGPRLIADRGQLMWSPDGSQYLLETPRPTVTGLVDAFLGLGSLYDGALVPLAKSLSLNWARFTSDSSQVLVSEAIYDGRQDVLLVDPRKSTEATSQHVARMGPRDVIHIPAFPSDLLITTSRENLGDSATLRASTLSNRTYDLDTCSPDEQFRYVTFSSGGSFVAYQKGKDPEYQTAYVDLRYRENWGYRAVRVGGDDGRVNTFNFDAAGTGLYYVYERANGARECHFLDLSRQVPRPPVKVSRDGRVERCLPPP